MNLVCVLNGATTVRERTTEHATVLECGCAHTDVLWVQMCRPHMSETNAFRATAKADHDRETAIKELTS